MKEQVLQKLQDAVKKLTPEDIKVELSTPNDSSHGDYATNVAFQLAKLLGKSPLQIAQELVEFLQTQKEELGLDKVEAVAPGFINFYLSNEALSRNLQKVLKNPEKAGHTTKMQGKKIMVEFAHPNTHKEMHIGHMRTLITGESVARLLESQGAGVFRANYQGDIGPHVAKALYGIEKIMEEKGLSLDDVEEWSNKDKAHFLGEGYVRGNQDYEESKEAIDDINNKLYKKEAGYYWDLYQKTRKWSLDYYDEFYTRFYTKYDRLFMESEMYEQGKKIVEGNVGTIFVKDTDGSIIFPGEKYGLHTRVFITQAGNPTYEGKEIQNAFAEWEAFHFDTKIHVVASEQAGYFQVVFKALDLLDPEKFVGKQYHLSMGMVQLVGKKMSSRTGEILTVDWLLDQVKAAAEELFKEGKLVGQERDEVLEEVAIGAVKYSVLKSGTRQDTLFDIEKSVSLDGNSGPYVQYAYTRTQSVLDKAGGFDVIANEVKQSSLNHEIASSSRQGGTPRNDEGKLPTPLPFTLHPEESEILRKLVHFAEVVETAATTYSPNVVTEYLFELAQLFNNFYQKYRIVNAATKEEKEFRLALTAAVGVVLKQGLQLLGIQAPEKM